MLVGFRSSEVYVKVCGI